MIQLCKIQNFEGWTTCSPPEEPDWYGNPSLANLVKVILVKIILYIIIVWESTPFGKVVIFGWRQLVFLNIIEVPISPSRQFALIFLTFICIPVRKIRVLLYIPAKTISQRLLGSIWQNTATIVPHTDAISDFPGHVQGIMVLDDDWSRQFINAFVLLVVDVVRFDDWAVFFDGIWYFLFGTVPFNDTFMLWVQNMRSETLDLFFVLL